MENRGVYLNSRIRRILEKFTMDLIKSRRAEITDKMDIVALANGMREDGHIDEDAESLIVSMPSQKGKMARLLRLLCSNKKLLPPFWNNLKKTNNSLYEEMRTLEKIDLGGNRRVRATVWDGTKIIDIREYAVRLFLFFSIHNLNSS